MSLIVALIATIVTVVISTLITYFTDFRLGNFSLFFIVPVGAILQGTIPGFAYYHSLFKKNVKIKGIHYLAGLAIGLVVFLGVLFGQYYMTSVNLMTGERYYSLVPTEEHISNIELPGYGQMTFLNYQRVVIDTTSYSFSRRARALGEVSNPIFSWIMSFIFLLGTIGGVLLFGYANSKKPYCERCEEYKSKKSYKPIYRQDNEELLAKIKESAANTLLTKEELLSIFENNPINNQNVPFYYEPVIYTCNSCRDSHLQLVKHNYNRSKKKYYEDSSFDFQVKLPASVY